jgi:hypothetical protein
MKQLPEESIFLVTSTIRRMRAKDLPEAIEEAKRRRGDGYRTEIVFREQDLHRRGMMGNMQDLLELERDLLP